MLSVFSRLLRAPLPTSSRMFAASASKMSAAQLKSAVREVEKAKKQLKRDKVAERKQAEKEKAQRQRERLRARNAREKKAEAKREAKAIEAAKPKKPVLALKPLSAFIKLNYAAVKATMPNAKPTAVLTAVVLKYKTATEAQKQEIEKLIQTDRQRYEEQLKVYYALKPKRPLNKYAAFVKSQWPIVKSANPGKSFTEMSALIKSAYAKAL